MPKKFQPSALVAVYSPESDGTEQAVREHCKRTYGVPMSRVRIERVDPPNVHTTALAKAWIPLAEWLPGVHDGQYPYVIVEEVDLYR